MHIQYMTSFNHMHIHIYIYIDYLVITNNPDSHFSTSYLCNLRFFNMKPVLIPGHLGPNWADGIHQNGSVFVVHKPCLEPTFFTQQHIEKTKQ